MKYLVVLSLIAAVASAGYIKPTPVTGEVAQIQEIIAAINSPSTDPATAAALEQLLLQTLGLPQKPTPAHDGGAVTAEQIPVVNPTPVASVPAPVVVGDVAADAATPLVQIILNIDAANSGAVVGAPAAVPAPAAAVDPVQVVDEASVVPSPVLVVEQPSVAVAAPEPVVIAPEPIQIGAPIVPQPIVLLPDILN